MYKKLLTYKGSVKGINMRRFTRFLYFRLVRLQESEIKKDQNVENIKVQNNNLNVLPINWGSKLNKYSCSN